MIATKVRNAYRKTEAHAEIHPVKLVHLIYERILVHLEYARDAIIKKDPRTRGENLAKVIGLITELNAAVKEEDNTEAAQFLRGLYTAILLELPKVSLTNDLEILKKTYRYVRQLKEIWEQTAMKELGNGGKKTDSGHYPGAKDKEIPASAAGISVAI